MQKITLSLFLIITIVFQGFTQDKFVYNETGLTPHLVTETPNVNQQKLYEKTINWIKENYKNPDEVIKTTIENEKVRFEGVSSSVLMTKIIGRTSYSDIRYTIEVSFKDEKYKITPLSLEYYTEPSQYATAGWTDISLSGRSILYYGKKNKLKSVFKTYPQNIQDFFNGLNEGIQNYVLEKNKAKDDW